MAKIRHIAIFTDNAIELAEFYRDVFGLTITRIWKEANGAWLTDDSGEFQLALLPRINPDNAPPKGINHFGFTVTPEEKEKILEKLKAHGCNLFYPANRPYTEVSSRDIQGNRFDISTGLQIERADGFDDHVKEIRSLREQQQGK